jgi:O-antigen/teichoic acid export membrane protein
MLGNFLKEYRKSVFFKNVFHLMSGTFLAQLLLVLSTPILSRLFDPDDFGMLALFISMQSILVILGTCRLEIAIMLPKELRDAIKIVLFIILQSFLLLLILYFILLTCGSYLISLFDLNNISNVLFLLPISMFLLSLNTALKYLKNRKYKYKGIRNCTVVEGGGRAGFNISIGLAKSVSFGLIYGYLASLFVSSIVWIGKEYRELFFELKNFEINDVKYIFRKYRNIFTHVSTGALINSISCQAPIFLMTYFYSIDVVGQYSMAQRLVSLPIVFIMTAFADSFRQRAADEFRENGNIRGLFLKNVKRLFFIGILPFTVLIFMAPFIFKIFLGMEWEFAGVMVQVLTLMTFINFVVMGLSGVVIQVSEFFKFELYWQISFSILSILGFIIGHYFFEDVLYALAFYSLGCILMYFFSFVIAYKYSVKI